MADIVGGRVADTQIVHSAALPQAELVDCSFRKLRQICVGEWARGPLTIKRIVRIVAGALSPQGMRKLQVPSRWCGSAECFFFVEICFAWKRKGPGFSVVFLNRMRFGIGFHKRESSVDIGGDPTIAVKPSGGGFVSTECDCAARFQGKANHASGCASLHSQLVGKSRDSHSPRAVSA